MSRLKEILLKDVADCLTGPFGSQLHESDYVEDGTPIVTVEHLGEIGFTRQNLPLVSDEDKNRLSRYILKEGDIVFSRVGSVDRSTYVSEKEDGWMFSGRCIRVRANSNINARYLSFYFRQKFFKKMMLQISVGATMPSLNTKLMDNISLKVHPRITQDKIASVLSSLDAKIELNNRINAELEAMAKTLYDYWFVQFDFPISAEQATAIGQPELKGKPYKSSGGKMVWNKELKRKIPAGWEVGTFDDIGTIIGGSTPSKAVNENFCINNGTPWITPKDLSLNKGNKFITRGEFDVTDGGIKEASLKLMPKGTILLSSRAPIGYLAISRETVTTNQGFKSFVPDKGYSTQFVYYAIKNMIPVIENNAAGSTFKEVSGGTLKSIKISLANKAILDSYDEKVVSIFNRQNLLELENQQLASLRDWLLPMLMNGQVKVGEAGSKTYTAGEGMDVAAEPRGEYEK